MLEKDECNGNRQYSITVKVLSLVNLLGAAGALMHYLHSSRGAGCRWGSSVVRGPAPNRLKKRLQHYVSICSLASEP